MQFLKKLGSDTALYGLSSVLGRMVNFLLVFLHTQPTVMALGDYGTVSELYANAALLNIFYLYGMETAFFRFAADKKYNPLAIFRLSTSSLLLTSFLLSAVLWILAEPLSMLMGYEGKAYFIQIFALILAIDAIAAIPFAYLRLQGRSLKFALVKLANICINVFLNIFFLYICPKAIAGDLFGFLAPVAELIYNPEIGLAYVFIANLVANFMLLPMLWNELRQFRFHLPAGLWKKMLLYAYPMIFTGVAFAINEVADRNLLKYWLPEGFYPGRSSLDAVGIYSACYKLSIFITLGVQAFKYAVEPFFFSKAQDKDSPETFALLFKYFSIICLLVFLGISVNLNWLQYILRGEGYREGIHIVPILLLANVALGMYYNLAVWFKVTDKTHYGAFIGLLGAAVTITMNLILIPFLGYTGSAIATLLCYTTMCAVCYFTGKKFYPIPYPWMAVIVYGVFASLLAAVGFYLHTDNFYIDFVLRNALIVLFVGVAWSRERKVFLGKP
ncbi:MAG: polysaccharide biosynthesis C-terminal domain-containing protein [Bernardetiaceae bacterium]|nr:polysaccharide biosynthesis C-terminal domain-containing protein [Bernardetiaceae bacterium]